MIDREAAQQAASAAGVRQFIWREEVDSTQRLANDLLRQNALTDTPALVVAARQTAGVGRGGNRWWSQGGGLTFSLVVDTDALAIPPDRMTAASIAAADGICNAAQQLGAGNCQIKWPNDVLASGRKLSGLLIDARQQMLVVGVGVNIHQPPTDAPAEVIDRSISLAQCAGRPVNVADTLQSLIREIVLSFRRLGDESTDLLSQWNARSALNHRQVRIETAAGAIAGEVTGIDTGGELLVRSGSAVHRVSSGTVTSIIPPLR